MLLLLLFEIMANRKLLWNYSHKRPSCNSQLMKDQIAMILTKESESMLTSNHLIHRLSR